MLKTLLGLVAIAAIVSGCASERSGADFLAMSQKMGPPRAGHSRIVVLREKGYGGIVDQGWDVKLDGGPMADLKTGTYVYADRPAGRHELSASADLFPGISKRDFAAAPGKTYFFLTRPSDRAKALGAMSAAGGVAGLVIGAAVTSNNANPGPLDFFPLEEAEARTMINFASRRSPSELVARAQFPAAPKAAVRYLGEGLAHGAGPFSQRHPKLSPAA